MPPDYYLIRLVCILIAYAHLQNIRVGTGFAASAAKPVPTLMNVNLFP
jgi:hypothetical protein